MSFVPPLVMHFCSHCIRAAIHCKDLLSH